MYRFTVYPPPRKEGFPIVSETDLLELRHAVEDAKGDLRRADGLTVSAVASGDPDWIREAVANVKRHEELLTQSRTRLALAEALIKDKWTA